jgi:hypothetical protein
MHRRGTHQASHPTLAGWGSRRRALLGVSPDGRNTVAFRAQLASMGLARGTDRDTTPPQVIPRTTNADVTGLVTFWSKALDADGGKSPSVLAILASPIAVIMSMDTPGDAGGIEAAARRWRTEAFLANEFIPALPPGNVYQRNAPLWHAIMTLATELDALQEAPTKLDIAEQSTADSAKHLAQRLHLETVGKYILIGAGVVGAAVLAVKLMEHRR